VNIELFVQELENQLRLRLDATADRSPEANALYDVLMAITAARKAAVDAM